jgi:hypothetical protein
VFGVLVCVHSGVGRTYHVKQLCNLEALGWRTAITCFLSVLTIFTTDESGKVHVATIAAHPSSPHSSTCSRPSVAKPLSVSTFALVISVSQPASPSSGVYLGTTVTKKHCGVSL